MPAPKPPLKQRLTEAALTALGWLPLPLLHALGLLLGALLIVIPNALARVSWAQMRHCLPGWPRGQQRRLVWASLVHSMMAVVESPALWFGPRSRLARWTAEPAAAVQLKALQGQGKGVILLCPHWGAWELAGLFVSAHAPITSLYKPQKGVMDALILKGRSRLGATLAVTDATGVKKVVGALKRGEVVGILPDHDPPDHTGVFAPFFGQPAHTMDLVTKLAARSGAPVWFCVAERRPFLGFRVLLIEAPAGITDPATGVAAMNAGVEALVRRNPWQYWWGYKRFRRRPPGAPNPY